MNKMADIGPRIYTETLKGDHWQPLRTHESLLLRFEALSARLTEIYAYTYRLVYSSDGGLKPSMTLPKSLLDRLKSLSYELTVWLSDLSPPAVVAGVTEGTRRSSSHSLDVIQREKVPPVKRIYETVTQLERNSKALQSAYKDWEIQIGTSISPWKKFEGSLDDLDELLHILEDLKSSIYAAVNTSRHATQEETTAEMGPQPPSTKLQLLALDGGGVRSYSSIMILGALMEEVHSIEKQHMPDESEKDSELLGRDSTTQRSDAKTSLKPCQVFDYVFGTSSGGILAIMLGRLQMDQNECEAAFSDYTHRLLRHQHWFQTYRFPMLSKTRRKRLEKTIRDMVDEYDHPPESLQWAKRMFCSPWSTCKTGVVAYPDDEKGSRVQLFRSYDAKEERTGSTESSAPAGLADSCQIWQAALATSAIPNYFSRVTVEDKDYTDGGLGAKNPSLVALNEVIRNHGKNLRGSLVVSFGCGNRPAFRQQLSFRDGLAVKLLSRPLKREIHSVASWASDTDLVDERVSERCEALGMDYYRFSVDFDPNQFAFNSWDYRSEGGEIKFETIKKLQQHTALYLMNPATREKLRNCAHAIFDRLRSKAISTKIR